MPTDRPPQNANGTTDLVRHKPAVRGAQSIDRALQLLQIVAMHHAKGISLQQLVHASALDRTTAYRIASSLVHTRLLQRDPDSNLYRLGVETMALGMAAMERVPLIDMCIPIMKALARRSGESVFLVVRSGDYSHCLHLEEGPRPVRTFGESVGGLRLLGFGIPSFALLAQMTDANIAAHYERHAAEYQSQRLTFAKLQRWVRQTREQGYALITAKGLGGVGMRFAMGSCGDAAIGIVTPAVRSPRSRGPVLAAFLQEELLRLFT